MQIITFSEYASLSKLSRWMYNDLFHFKMLTFLKITVFRNGMQYYWSNKLNKRFLNTRKVY